METNWYKEFELPEPDAGGKGQEVADPAGTNVAEGEKGQEVADPAVTDTDGATAEPTGTGTAGDDPATGETGGGEMDPETRRQQAAARKRAAAEEAQRQRQQEINEAVRAAVAEALKEQEKNFFANSTILDPYTGKTVSNMEEWRAYQAAQGTNKLAADLKAGKLTPESLQSALMSLPAFQNLIQGANEQARQAQAAQESAGREQFKARTAQELAEIRKLNQSVQSLNDIVAMPTGQRFSELVQKGNSFLDAYRLANFEDLQSRSRAAGEQSARNAAAGLQHQQRVQQQGQGQAAVPADVKAWYRDLIPGISDAEIAKAYNKTRT